MQDFRPSLSNGVGKEGIKMYESYRRVSITVKEGKDTRGVIYIAIARGNGISADYTDETIDEAKAGVKRKIDQQYALIEHNRNK